MSHSEYDPRDLRRAFGCFLTGVTIVTTVDEDGTPCGFTANSFTSVSLEPPLILVNIATSAFGAPVFTSAKGFVVNILASNQRGLSNRFARAGEDKFADVEWRGGKTGAPILDEVVSWFDCEQYQQVEAGDHIILIGKVVDYDYNTHSPLGFCRGTYVSSGVTPQMLELISSPGELRVGAIVESDGKILLERDASSGRLALPFASTTSSQQAVESLNDRLASAGLEVEFPFIFSAWEENGVRYVYYTGELQSPEAQPSSSELSFYDVDLITWEEINSAAVISMLQRYIREKKIGNFNTYIGDPDHGETHPVEP